MTFSPKGADILKTEILETTNLEYEGNEEVIDKLVERGLKDEALKASLHEQKLKAQQASKPLETEEKAPVIPVNETPKNENMSLKDIRALADVSDEDVDDVIEYAKFKNITIAEAKKSPVIQMTLQTKAEERRTAEATSTATTRRTSGQSTDDKILGNYEKGELPESEEDNAALAKAQFDKLLKGAK